MIAAALWFGVTAIVIIPKKVKYSNVKYMKYKYQANFRRFHSNDAMKQKMPLQMTDCMKTYGNSIVTCFRKMMRIYLLSNGYNITTRLVQEISRIQKNNGRLHTWANANARGEYILAAFSLYETNRSTDTTGCTAVAFVIPMNRTAAYIDPIALKISCWVPLHQQFNFCQKMR